MPHAAAADRRIRAVASIVSGASNQNDFPRHTMMMPYDLSAPPAISEGDAYYHTKRGALPRWHGWGVSWSLEGWAKFHPYQDVAHFAPTALLVVTGEKAWSRDIAKGLYDAANGPKQIHIVAKAGHRSFFAEYLK